MKNMILCFFLCCFGRVVGQEVILEGIVLDSKTNKPLIGVNVFNTKKTRITITNFQGTFKIKTYLNDEVRFSYMGYQQRTIKVNSNKRLSILLTPEVKILNDVYVIAKKNINDIDLRKSTGSVITLKAKKIAERPTTNIIQSLQGQVAGLTVKADGELGKPLKIRIRGNTTLPIKSPITNKISEEQKATLDNRANQPLFVLDGQIISAEAFETLNVNDIDNIKVLKDAIANALYGVKASNGVIEITSKRGINGKTQYSFSLQQGVTFKGNPSKIMMNTEEKLEFERLSKNSSTPGYYFSEQYIRHKNRGAATIEKLVLQGQKSLDSLKNINTNWFEELSKINTYQSYNLSTRGGNEVTKFYMSANFSKHGGKFDGNQINRFTGKLNYEYNVSKKIYAMLNGGFGIGNSKTPNASNYSPANLVYELNPYEQKKQGVLISYPNYTFKNLVNQYSKNENNKRFNFSINLTAKISKDLYLATLAGMDYLISESLAIVPPTAFSQTIKGNPIKERGEARKNKTTTINYNTNTRINFNKTFGKHNLSLSANFDYFKQSNDFIGIKGYGLPSKLLSGAGINNDLSNSKKSVTYSSKRTDATLGFGVSALYNWNNKIDIYGSYKKDGSSVLPSDKRWNIFWATGIGYTLSNELFFKNITWLNLLKLRGSYGVTASLSGISASLAVPTFTYGSTGYLGIREFYLKDLFNKGLRPEQNTSINLGLDMRFFNSLNITLEIYHRRTKDMLLTVPIPPSNGFYQQLKNVGIMDNKGIEVSFNSMLINTKNFRWNTSVNVSYNSNKVIDLYSGTTLTLTKKQYEYVYPDYEEGKPSDLIYGLIYLGVNPADGQPLFQRRDGSSFNGNLETPNKDDFFVLGHSTPPITGGWSHDVNYKNWQLSFNIYYSFGGKSVFTNKTKVYSVSDVNKNLPKSQLNKTWFEIGDINKIYPRLNLHINKFGVLNSFPNLKNVGSTDFIRLNNIVLRYKFTTPYLNKISNGRIKNWNIYAQLTNIYTWSNFKGGDPESANLQGSAQPILTMGLNISF